MNKNCIFIVTGFFLLSSAGCETERKDDSQAPLVGEAMSQVSRTDAKELILIQEVTFAAPIEEVWGAYTTAVGWTAWASPKAEIDLRVGGTIRTAYQGEIGGNITNTLHIVNYVPERLLTLRAELASNWPEILQEDADKMSNVVLFDEVGDDLTRIQSYGIGYSDTPKVQQMMGFFIKANESLFQNLRTYLETGTRTEWSK